MSDYNLSPDQARKLLRDLESDEEMQDTAIAREIVAEIRRKAANKIVGFLFVTFAFILTAGAAVALSAYLIRKALGY